MNLQFGQFGGLLESAPCGTSKGGLKVAVLSAPLLGFLPAR